MTRAFLFAAAIAVVGSGCAGHYVSRGADLYAGGRYIEAAEVFELTEQRLPGTSVPERARYGLYRGATLLALGDMPRAATWLGYSAEIVARVPAALSEEEGAMLRRALAIVAERHTSPQVPPAEDTAVAATHRAKNTAAADEIGN